VIFKANKFGSYVNRRFSIRPLFDGKWRAAHGRHLIGIYEGADSLSHAQRDCAKYRRDNAAAARLMARKLRRRK
jgi:hypothetical protein